MSDKTESPVLLAGAPLSDEGLARHRKFTQRTMQLVYEPKEGEKLVPLLRLSMQVQIAEVVFNQLDYERKLFEARDKELCQAHDDFRQQVATELAELLESEQTELVGMGSYELKPPAHVVAKNKAIRAAATRLGLDLSAPTS